MSGLLSPSNQPSPDPEIGALLTQGQTAVPGCPVTDPHIVGVVAAVVVVVNERWRQRGVERGDLRHVAIVDRAL
jgi:hypothetical protein